MKLFKLFVCDDEDDGIGENAFLRGEFSWSFVGCAWYGNWMADM
jgi:hypothetical protein